VRFHYNECGIRAGLTTPAEKIDRIDRMFQDYPTFKGNPERNPVNPV
jgi:hypothetical protein